jgi:UDP-N-acetylglucosamine acyltransferase
MEDTTPHQNKTQNATMNVKPNYINRGNNFVHPTAIIGNDVQLGEGNYIGEYCVIKGDTTIGNNNRFEAFCSIGTEPEHKSYFGKPNKGVVIGNNNVIREYVTINAGCEIPTQLENNIIMLRGSHCGHDVIISNDCTISCNVLLGGHTFVGIGANIGLGAIVHQFSKIGSYSMIGMGAIITKKVQVQCFDMYVGNPARFIKRNKYQFDKFNLDQIAEIVDNFNKI